MLIVRICRLREEWFDLSPQKEKEKKRGWEVGRGVVLVCLLEHVSLVHFCSISDSLNDVQHLTPFVGITDTDYVNLLKLF